MKRFAILLISGLIAASAVGAQTWGGPQGGPGPMMGQYQNQTPVKIEGKLTLVNGMIAVVDKDKTYYVGGVNRLVGFVDGLKENASVKLEGYAAPIPAAPEYLFLQVTKLTFNGKDYDLSQFSGRGRGWCGDNQDGGWGHGGMMGGRGFRR